MACLQCGGEFVQRPNEKPYKFRQRRFCSRACTRAYNHETAEDNSPSPEEITALTADIRSGWTEWDYYVRSRFMSGDNLKWKRS